MPLNRSSRKLIVALASSLAALTGCSDGSDGSAASVLGDARATLVEELRIDGHEADLVPIRALAVAEDGMMAVTQSQDAVVRFFASTGDPLGAVGGRGQGPGEFTAMTRLGWLADTLWVYDPTQSRMTLISADRTFARSMRVPREATPTGVDLDRLPAFQGVGPLGLLADDALVATLELLDDTNAPDPFKNHAAIGRITLDGTIENVIALIPTAGLFVRVPEGQMGVPFANVPIFEVSPLGDRTVVVLASLEGADAGSFSVTSLDSNGDSLFSLRYPFDGVPIPREVGDSILAVGAAIAQRSPAMAAAYRREVRIPPVYPPLDAAVIGRDQTIWIEHIERPEGRTYLVLQEDGVPLGTLELPPGRRIAAAERDRVWVLERDEYDVESIVRYGVEWR